VIIDHGNGEFSLLGHLRQGSLRVKIGDRIRQGQAIARDRGVGQRRIHPASPLRAQDRHDHGGRRPSGAISAISRCFRVHGQSRSQAGR
jgi:hypothetical protein